MFVNILGSAAGIPSKQRNTQAIIFDLVDEMNEYFLIDAGEALQHQLLQTSIKPSKINHVFITHLHGDHIYGLPGFLSSRAHQGGENRPLTIYGPKGLEEWLNLTFEISESSLNYPLYFVEVNDGDTFQIKEMSVTVKLLEHNLDSFLYIFKERDKVGALNVEKLKSIGIMPGPKYKEIKDNEQFIYEGVIYDTKDFLGPTILGRKVCIHGDTRVQNNKEYLSLIEGASCVVHEATFLDYEYEKSHDYCHSEIHKVLEAQKNSHVNMYIFTHISNRYDEDFVKQFAQLLPEKVYIAYDFFKIEIPRKNEETN